MEFQNELNEFLNLAYSQKEINLCIFPQNKKEEYLAYFKSNQFLITINIQEFLNSIINPSKTIILVTEDNLKDIYDIVSQFSTGQISYFDNSSMETKWFTPQYDKSTILVLISKNLIESYPQILNQCGLTYQE